MAGIKIAGIMRAGIFSPNHIGNDATIFNNVADQLRKRGCEVNIYSEELFCSGAVKEHIILNMCREHRSIELLQKREDEGDLVINSGYGIENCIRERMTRILIGSGLPHPQSFIVSTNESVRDMLSSAKIGACWIKRGDSHTQHREDVTYVRHPEEAQEVLQEFFLRGINRAVISRHLEGELIKFYGVAGTPFFYWFYVFQAGYRKYGDEAINSHEKDPKFDLERLKGIANRAASELGIKIYGGECIISDSGDMQIIDFNDWPSFAPCRAESAPHIAKFVMSEIKNYLKS